MHTPRLKAVPARDALDFAAAYAGAYDAEAMDWLGWFERPRPEVVQWLLEVTEHNRARRSRELPASLRSVRHWRRKDSAFFVLVDRAEGRCAGAVSVQVKDGEVGGWLAPRFRGVGLGTELFRAGADIAHEQLGMTTVRAGTQRSNTACRRALEAAGYEAAEGPSHHTLPDGRTVEACWYAHQAHRRAELQVEHL
ncbi:GNAT family N-acetyltransferase [Streptacidiphilus anmyonensis]|uniref:GNAT family N-acetyltransferase n=1 Tax=Streptacidiphilus anmyonensis TaxID=405782 RepID=UPI001364A2C2|nr:GNAT family protein [Streptacidiphilus anmyonensis]